jgi:PilZ domain
MAHAERRREPRSIPETRSYISFGVSNGAMVSDFSAGGLGFQAVAPVPMTGAIRFYLSLEPSHRVEAVGEVVWTDETKMRGGLRFTLVPEEVRTDPSAEQSSPQMPRPSSETPLSDESSHVRIPLCPLCGNRNVHRSHRQGFLENYLLCFLGLSPYRCEACYRRFFRRG